jgi:hypothetical protein
LDRAVRVARGRKTDAEIEVRLGIIGRDLRRLAVVLARRTRIASIFGPIPRRDQPIRVYVGGISRKVTGRFGLRRDRTERAVSAVGAL